MVANYTPHQYLRFGGKFGPEEWSVGLRLQVSVVNLDVLWETVAEILNGKVPTPTVQDEAVSAYIAVKAEPIISTFFNALKSMTDGTALNYVSCNHIGRDGKYTSAQSFRNDLATPVAAAPVGSYFLGPDVAVAVTFLTGIKRGYCAKGRIYLPLNNLALNRAESGWGEISSANRTSILTATKNMVNSLNDLGGLLDGVEPAVSVFSPGTGKYQSPAQPGGYRRVTSIRVGSQPDTQRRRVNKQPDLWDGDSTFEAAVDA